MLNSFGKAVPYASIRLSGTSEGTITNEEGFFRFILKQSLSLEVVISSIGYKTKTVQIHPSASPLTINLEGESQNLNEVIVQSGDFLKKLLTQAYNGIITNYTRDHIEMTGFYRETQKSKEGRYLYFGEGAIKLQQSGYGTSFEDAQIELLDSRTRTFSERDTIDNALYYGGAYVGNWNDAVKMRKDFLNPAFYNKRYVYHLEEESSYNNGKDTLYTVSFQSKGKTDGLSGKFWIDKTSGAYLKIAYRDNKVSKSNPISPVKRLSRDFLAVYYLYKGKYLLSYTSMKANTYNSTTQKGSLHEIEFVVTGTKIGDEIEGTIPMRLRMNPGTVFSQIENTTNGDFQSTYTTMEMDSSLKQQLGALYLNNGQKGIDYEIRANSRLKPIDRLYRALSRVGLSYSLNGLWNGKSYGEPATIHFREAEVKRGATSYGFFPATNISLGYSLNNLSSVRLDLSGSIMKGDIIDIKRVSYTRYVLIKKYGNPIFISGSAGVARIKNGRRYGKLESNNDLVIEDKNFGHEVEVFTGSKGVSGYLETGLEYRRSRLAYFLTAAYSPVITNRAYLIFSKKRNIFFTKQQWIEMTNAVVKTSSNSTMARTYPYCMSIGVRLNF